MISSDLATDINHSFLEIYLPRENVIDRYSNFKEVLNELLTRLVR